MVDVGVGECDGCAEKFVFVLDGGYDEDGVGEV